MKYLWIDEYLLAKRGVTKDLQESWNWIRYHIGGKMFAAICLDENDRPYYINLKLEPQEGEFFRQQYEDVIPGYYSNKQHWNSVNPDGTVPDELLKTMLDKSYALVLSSFSKKRQREILKLSCCGTACGECEYFGAVCKGCTEADGKVFHTSGGKACPIYACSVQKKKLATCASCGEAPCSIWRETRDPNLSDQAFEESITNRMRNLKGAAKPDGVRL